MPSTIRPATLRDAATLCDHRKALCAESGSHTDAELAAMAVAFRPWLEKHMTDGTYLSWLAVTPTGEIIAEAALWLLDWPPHVLAPGTPRARVINVYTRPEYRRQGLSRRLMQTAIEWCRKQNIHCLMLQSTPGARPLYESLGFQPVPEMRLIL